MSSGSSPTQITVLLNLDNEGLALYLIGESFTSTTFTVEDTQEKYVTWRTVFVLTHIEKHLTLALSAPITLTQIEERASLMNTGVILGFMVRGEIALGERIMNHLACNDDVTSEHET
jgi:hypothetical protein